jgi:flavin reductase (DIM6/NTAB) family NADH-FMN oxidoreductase RutF
MPIDPDTFRSVLGRFATGVTVITTRGDDGRDYGMTASAFTSLSLDPPMVLVCIGHEASMYPVISTASHFTVNVLAAEQEALSRRFAAKDPNRFDGVGYTRGKFGPALLDEALAYLECRVSRQVEAGDHTIFIGEVESAIASTGAAKPLLYYRGGYAHLER